MYEGTISYLNYGNTLPQLSTGRSLSSLPSFHYVLLSTCSKDYIFKNKLSSTLRDIESSTVWNKAERIFKISYNWWSSGIPRQLAMDWVYGLRRSRSQVRSLTDSFTMGHHSCSLCCQVSTQTIRRKLF